MAVARSDEGPGNLTRKRLPRKVGDVGIAPPPSTKLPPVGAAHLVQPAP